MQQTYYRPYPIVRVYGLGPCALIQDNGPLLSRYVPLAGIDYDKTQSTVSVDWGDGPYALVLERDGRHAVVRIMLKPA